MSTCIKLAGGLVTVASAAAAGADLAGASILIVVVALSAVMVTAGAAAAANAAAPVNVAASSTAVIVTICLAVAVVAPAPLVVFGRWAARTAARATSATRGQCSSGPGSCVGSSDGCSFESGNHECVLQQPQLRRDGCTIDVAASGHTQEARERDGTGSSSSRWSGGQRSRRRRGCRRCCWWWWWRVVPGRCQLLLLRGWHSCRGWQRHCSASRCCFTHWHEPCGGGRRRRRRRG